MLLKLLSIQNPCSVALTLWIKSSGKPGGNSCFLAFLLYLVQFPLEIEDRGETFKLEEQGFKQYSKLRRLLYNLPIVMSVTGKGTQELALCVMKSKEEKQSAILSTLKYLYTHTPRDEYPAICSFLVSLQKEVRAGAVTEQSFTQLDAILRTHIVGKLESCLEHSRHLVQQAGTVSLAFKALLPHFQAFRKTLILPGFIDHHRINEQSDMLEMLRLLTTLGSSEDDRVFRQTEVNNWEQQAVVPDVRLDDYSEVPVDFETLIRPSGTVIQVTADVTSGVLSDQMNAALHSMATMEDRRYIEDDKVYTFSHQGVSSGISHFPKTCSFVLDISEAGQSVEVPHYVRLSESYMNGELSETGQLYKLQSLGIRTGSAVVVEAGGNAGHYRLVMCDDGEWKLFDTLSGAVDEFDIYNQNTMEFTQLLPIYGKVDGQAPGFHQSFKFKKPEPVSFSEATSPNTKWRTVVFHSNLTVSESKGSEDASQGTFRYNALAPRAFEVTEYQQIQLFLGVLDKRRKSDRGTYTTECLDKKETTKDAITRLTGTMSYCMKGSVNGIPKHDFLRYASTLMYHEAKFICQAIENLGGRGQKRDFDSDALGLLMGTHSDFFDEVYNQCLLLYYSKFKIENLIDDKRLPDRLTLDGYVSKLEAFLQMLKGEPEGQLNVPYAIAYLTNMKDVVAAIRKSRLYFVWTPDKKVPAKQGLGKNVKGLIAKVGSAVFSYRRVTHALEVFETPPKK